MCLSVSVYVYKCAIPCLPPSDVCLDFLDFARRETRFSARIWLRNSNTNHHRTAAFGSSRRDVSDDCAPLTSCNKPATKQGLSISALMRANELTAIVVAGTHLPTYLLARLFAGARMVKRIGFFSSASPDIPSSRRLLISQSVGGGDDDDGVVGRAIRCANALSRSQPSLSLSLSGWVLCCGSSCQIIIHPIESTRRKLSKINNKSL